MTKILAIGAHAADVEFSVGPVLAAASHNGSPVSILHLTWGEKGHPALPPKEYALQKESEARAAAAILGCYKVIGLGEPDAALAVNDTIAHRIAEIIQEEQPNTILTHWGGSFHSDHRNTYHLVHRALFLASLPSPRQWEVNRMFYTDNWEDQESFSIDGTVDVSDHIDTWLNACNTYTLFTRGGILGFNYKQYYTGLYQMRGALSRTTWAVGLKEQPARERVPALHIF